MMDPFARKMWAAGIGFAISLVVLALGLKIFSMHQWPTCPDRIARETDSPGKEWVAAILERRCGPESAFFTSVNLRRVGPLQRGFFTGQAATGSVFVVEEDTADAGISLKWSADDMLTIRCPHCTVA